MARNGKKAGIIGRIVTGIKSMFHEVARQATIEPTLPTKLISTGHHNRFRPDDNGCFGGRAAFRGPAHLQRKLDRKSVIRATDHWQRQREAAQKIREDQKRQLEKMIADAVIADSEHRFPARAAKV